MLADSDCSDFDRGQSSGAGCTLLPQMETAKTLHERDRKATLPFRSASPAGAGVADRGDL